MYSILINLNLFTIIVDEWRMTPIVDMCARCVKVFLTQEDAGTAHLSILGPNGDAISVTSTINLK